MAAADPVRRTRRVAKEVVPAPAAVTGSWTFLTNHAHVFLCVARDPDMRGRDIAEQVGITERAAQGIIADLVRDGYVTRTKVGRRNRYEVHSDLPLRHPLERDHRVAELLSLVGPPPEERRAARDGA